MTEPTADPVAELDARFGDPGATPTPWSDARALLDSAKVYWLSTVRPDGRPHVTPIAAVWVDGALHFTTGKAERKAKNLERNTKVVATTGSNLLEGLDVVVEGEAVLVTDETRLQRLADAYISKPFRAKELIDLVNSFARRDGGPGDGDGGGPTGAGQPS